MPNIGEIPARFRSLKWSPPPKTGTKTGRRGRYKSPRMLPNRRRDQNIPAAAAVCTMQIKPHAQKRAPNQPGLYYALVAPCSQHAPHRAGSDAGNANQAACWHQNSARTVWPWTMQIEPQSLDRHQNSPLYPMQVMAHAQNRHQNAPPRTIYAKRHAHPMSCVHRHQTIDSTGPGWFREYKSSRIPKRCTCAATMTAAARLGQC